MLGVGAGAGGVRPRVPCGHSVRHSGIASFTAQLEKVDTALPVSPLPRADRESPKPCGWVGPVPRSRPSRPALPPVLINTMGYKAKTANKVREALKRAYRLDHSSVFNVAQAPLEPLWDFGTHVPGGWGAGVFF